MEYSHRCKLCSRVFTNGRALGGHMKSHLSAPPPPPPPPPKPPSSSSDFLFSSEEKPTLFDLRENPKKSFRFSDPVFDILLQDRDSDGSSRHRKPSPEEDLAMCLMMLSRDRRIQNQNQNQNQRKKKCEKCTKQFRSYRALFSHERICQLETELEEEEEEEEEFDDGGKGSLRRRIFKCPFCYKLFGSGQALGGHKRSHLHNSSVSFKLQISLIDLNLPAPIEQDDDYSAVSDV